MKLRPDAIRARLDHLSEVTLKLQRLRRLSPDERDPWSVERGLQLGTGIILNIGAYVVAAHLKATTEGYEQILERLARHGVIPGELRQQLRGLGRFRNLLIHAYLDLDPDKIDQHLETAPEDFSRFSRAIDSWLATVEPESEA